MRLVVYATATRSPYWLANTSTILPIGSVAVHVTTGSPIWPLTTRETVSVRPCALAPNVAFGPRCASGSLIDSLATTSAPAFSQLGAPFAAPPTTFTGVHTLSWLTRYGRSTPENPPKVSAAAGMASSRVATRAARITVI